MEADYQFDIETIEYDRPPTPPLAAVNINLETDEQINIEQENWNEGSDSKWKTYQNIRKHKKKIWAEEKEMKKHQAKFNNGMVPNTTVADIEDAMGASESWQH